MKKALLYWCGLDMVNIYIFGIFMGIALFISISMINSQINPIHLAFILVVILVGVAPVMTFIVRQRFTMKAPNGYLICAVKDQKVIDFGECIWKKKGINYMRLPELRDDAFSFDFKAACGDKEIAISVTLLIFQKKINREVQYPQKLYEICLNNHAMTNPEQYFKRKIGDKIEKNQAAFISLVVQKRTGLEEGKLTDRDMPNIIDYLTVLNPFYELAEIRIQIGEITVQKILPPSC